MAQTIDKVAWIRIVDRRVLAARSRGKDRFYLPGGKREAGETDQACLIREITEELGVALRPETLVYLGRFEAAAHGHGVGHPAGVAMTCYAGDYDGTPGAAAEIEEIRWLRHADKPLASPVTQLIFDWLQERDLID